MGLVIHYTGAIDRVEEIPQFVDELIDIAASMGWLAQAINMDEEAPTIRGVLVNPRGNCEPLRFLFDREGRLRNMMDLIDDRKEPNEHSFYSFSKTQFAPIETHVWIVGLLRYLKKRYLSNLKVTDEGKFWETEDLETLRETKGFLSDKIDQIAGALSETEPLPEDSSVDALVARIEAIVNGLHGDGTPKP